MKTKLRFAALLLGLLFAVYLFFQIYNTVSPTYKSEVAVLYELSDTITSEGFVLRSENVSSPVTGTLYYTVSNGERVAKGAVVGERFGSEEDAARSEYVKRLTEELEMVKSLSNEGRSGVNIDSVRRSIHSLLSGFSRDISRHQYSGIYDFRNQLLSLISSYQMASGSEIDVTEYQKLLEEKIREASAGASAAYGEVASDYSGYFIDYSDGCEDFFDPADIDSMTVELAEDLQQKMKDGYAVDNGRFRIVDDYDWYYVTVLDAASAARLKPGYRYSVEFAYSGAGELPATVYSVNYGAEGEKAAVVFLFDRVGAASSQLRNETATVRFSNYKGIKVDRTSLRLVDGELGVFIKYGDTVKFRRLNIIYETDDYVLSSATEGSSTLLSLYDEVIISGKNLYVDKHL